MSLKDAAVTAERRTGTENKNNRDGMGRPFRFKGHLFLSILSNMRACLLYLKNFAAASWLLAELLHCGNESPIPELLTESKAYN